MIVSTTLAGPGAEHIIADALRSVAPLADACLVLLSGCDVDATKAVAHEAVGAKLVTTDYPWPSDYGKARSDALRAAEKIGADWALTVDCDERLDIGLPDFSRFTGIDALCVPDAVLCYQKPRFIRCGVGAHWVGPCSEWLEVKGEKSIIDGQFRELPKTPEQERTRLLRGIEKMPDMIAQSDHHQWRRHYAECLIGVGRIEEGIEQHKLLREMAGTPQGAISWCDYRIAEYEIVQEQYDAAFRRCALALARDPGFIQEFGWLLAHISCKRKHHPEAILWATYALEAPLDLTRGGHRSPTWKAGCEALLASARCVREPARMIEAIQFTAEHFAGRREFLPDYRKLASALTRTLSFASHLDLGAGNGLLVEAMTELQVISSGIEQSEAAEAETTESISGRIQYGLGIADWLEGERHDLVSCVEVLEHVAPELADEAVRIICARSNRWVYFSAAQPGQGGVGHVNEQPREYWIAKFRDAGFALDVAPTERLAGLLTACERCWWLKRNALIFRRSGAES